MYLLRNIHTSESLYDHFQPTGRKQRSIDSSFQKGFVSLIERDQLCHAVLAFTLLPAWGANLILRDNTSILQT